MTPIDPLRVAQRWERRYYVPRASGETRLPIKRVPRDISKAQTALSDPAMCNTMAYRKASTQWQPEGVHPDLLAFGAVFMRLLRDRHWPLVRLHKAGLPIVEFNHYSRRYDLHEWEWKAIGYLGYVAADKAKLNHSILWLGEYPRDVGYAEWSPAFWTLTNL